MLFAVLKAGHYVIISNGVVVADIHRHYTYEGPLEQWRKAVYNVVPTVIDYDNGIVQKSFPTLADIQDEYLFDNADGYYNVLRRRN